MSWIIFILLLFFIVALLLRSAFFSAANLSRKSVLFFFVFKLLWGFLLQGVYTYYYKERKDADVYKYFDDAAVINSFKHQYPTAVYHILTGREYRLSPAVSDTILCNTQHFHKQDLGSFDANHRLLIRLHLLLLQFSMDNIATHLLIFCFLSFVGQFLLLKTVADDYPQHSIAAYLSLLLFPSVSFWGSGLLKENLLFFALGISIYALFHQKIFVRFILFGLGAGLLFLIKPLLLLILLFVLLVGFTIRTAHKKIVLTVIFLLLYFIYQFNIADYFIALALVKRNQFTTLAIAQHANSLLDQQLYYFSAADLLNLFIHNVFNAFFRPFVWEIRTLFNVLFCVEGFALLIVLLYCFSQRSFYHFLRSYSLYGYGLLFGVVYLFLISMTIPVLGAIVRYKVIALPFVLFPMLSYILEKNKFEKFLSIFKK